ncbi:hypothetical protein TanjilG_09374 [Lupinus angustifolius]|uniref:C2H2-type domain-containing protein n=1 Tax=Lupinus angustifolius TaxID=3871 RepID=A0A1J7G1A1_LUPAN|nr:PREDICTED: protein bowel-like [Lupinus angustifolius]OIV94219.1 hypothetical protein TanjilG_09374 [Lupinus angustifolius]
MEEKKFVCKFCSKKFPCGKSLGGHIRTHMSEQRNNSINNNDAECDNLNLDVVRMKQKRDLWCEAGYGLRENPKKTMRFVHSKAILEQQQEEKFCKECGKGFPSLKALCGHMACHSEKQKLVMDSHSDTEESSDISKHPRRSKRMKFKTLCISNDQRYSSSVSEVDQEQEEVARCLMLLSNDSSHKGGFALIDESSENNLVVVEEAKSSSVDLRNGVKNVNKFVSNGYDLVEKKELKLKSADNSDSGYYRYDPQTKMAKSDASKDEFKSEFDDYDVESGKMLNMNKERSKYTVTLFKKSVNKDLNYDGTGGTTSRFDSMKIANYDSFNHSKKMTNGFANDEIYETGERGLKYESLAYDSTYESDESSSDTDSFPAPKSHSSKVLNGKKCSKAKKKKLKSKKSKEHECPICYKIFKSGQALGGHKRSHFIGGSEENTVIINQGPCLIDLNLPAPIDE